MKKGEIGFFDSDAEYFVVQRKLPHWIQSGALCFVTWRAADSLPGGVLQKIETEIAEMIRRNGLDSNGDWKSELNNRTAKKRARIHRKLLVNRDKYLDQGHGRCLLGNQECAIEVERSLLCFDNERYFITDIVVMPNHVH